KFSNGERKRKGNWGSPTAGCKTHVDSRPGVELVLWSFVLSEGRFRLLYKALIDGGRKTGTMPKNRAASTNKKQQKRGVDFKKIKRKIGRRLPPPKNTTNTEVKSKAIVLPEQSVASDKVGLAVSKKGLTLKELLQQTSHHNARVRKDALMGMRDLFLKYPEELRSHRYAVIEKLRERISDDDKMVRENLYLLLKSVVLPACKEDNQGPIISMMMVYIFNAMAHLAIDVRLMSFKFLDLIVQYYPASFFMHAEKILQNYEYILKSNQFYVQDKGKLRNVLAGLVCCLSLLPSDKKEVDTSEQDALREEVLHAFEPDKPTESVEFSIINKMLKELLPVLLNCFQDFTPSIQGTSQLDAQSFDCMHSILQSIGLAVRFFIYGIRKDKLESQRFDGRHEMSVWDNSISSILLKQLLRLFPLKSIRDLSEKDGDRYFILNTLITEIYLCTSEWMTPSADLSFKFLAFVEYVLKISDAESGKSVGEKHLLLLIPFLPKLISAVAEDWKDRFLQAFTNTFLECSADSKIKLACLAVIEEMLLSKEDQWYFNSGSGSLDCQISWMRELPQLLIQLGDKHPTSSQAVLRLILRLGQYSSVNAFLASEYDRMQNSLKKFYSIHSEEGNIHIYWKCYTAGWKRSLASCCLCHELDEFMLRRVIEVLHSSYCAGHIQISDHVSFLMTLICRFKPSPESISYPTKETDASICNHGTFKSMTSDISACLSRIGDKSLVFLIVERVILEQMTLKPSLHNACAMLRVLVVLDAKPTKLSEQSILCIGDYLAGYLIDVVHNILEDNDAAGFVEASSYYFVPCFFLFDSSHRLFELVLKTMASLIHKLSTSVLSNEDDSALRLSSGIESIVGVLLLMHRDAKIGRLICSYKDDIALISRSIQSLLVISSHLTNILVEVFPCNQNCSDSSSRNYMY
ncbi:unnamed protein product, partial [Linum tenue]